MSLTWPFLGCSAGSEWNTAVLQCVPSCYTTSCANGFILLNGHCYYFAQVTMTYTAAKADCEARNSYLTILNDDAEKNTVYWGTPA